MSDDQTTYGKLAERFPASAHKTKPGSGGKALTYVDGEMVISRLNEVLDFNWSFRVVNQGTTDVEAWVLGEISAVIDGVTVVRQQYGAQELARGSRTVTDLFKSAATDAIKKCATTLGVGLYLYDDDDRSEVEAEMEAEKRVTSHPFRQGAAAPAGGTAAVTPPASGAAASSRSTTATAAAPTGSSSQTETTRQWWQRLVAEAEAVKLPTLGVVKAIDPKACPEAQLRRHAERLEARLSEVKAGAA